MSEQTRAGDPRTTTQAAGARPARRTPATWIRVAAGSLPATWVTVAATGAFLGATVAFGGLADAPAAEPEPLPVHAPGDTHTNEQFDIRVDRAVLIDELPGSGTFPVAGERVLAVTATMTNITDEPLLSTQFAGETFVAEALPDERAGGGGPVTPSVARLDDATTNPYLQPDVPVEVVVTWPVPADLLREGDSLRVTLSDYERYDFERLGGSEDDHVWTDPRPAAYVDLPIEDVGAGADQEEGSG
ncbi:hypothetical protein [Microbacterium sp. JZ31]|uniref:hypothetical protein n=1 Tax=Microbacterium sp. JZ31 TaxID=1906274 RepID=UPI0019339D2C|nr:hypothetical protein [Microbacterium sp. JZ31]